MSIVVHLFFSGLLAFAVESDHNGGMLLVPDSTSPHHAGHGMPSMVHHPLLKFSCSDLADVAAKQSCEAGSIPGLPGGHLEDGLMVVPLIHYDISLRPEGISAPNEKLDVKRLIRPPGAKKPGNAQEVQDFDWTIDIDKVLAPLALGAKPSMYLFSEPTNTSTEKALIGRVKLENGSLHTGVVQSGYGIWVFRTFNSYAVPYEQEAATDIIYDLKPLNYFVLRIADFSGIIKKELLFKSNLDISMFVTNEPDLDEFCKFENLSRVYHFAHLYALLGLSESSDLPLPVIGRRPISCRKKREEIVSGSGSGRLPVICMGAQFSAPELPAWIAE